MRNLVLGRTLITGAFGVFLFGACLLPHTAASQRITRATRLTAQTPPTAVSATAAGVTTQNDQTDLSLTVYNSDLALVRDVREISLPAGDFQLKFMDVAATLNPATVHFRSLAAPAA